MIRLTLLYVVVFGLAFYAWRDWFKSLCGLVVLMAVMEHPDMPKGMFGLQGLNAWNILLLVILLAWLARRREEGLVWDMPAHMNVLLVLYMGVLLVSFVRLIRDPDGIRNATTSYLVAERLINVVKWTIPGLLLFDGCRSRQRFAWGLLSVLAIYFLLGVQVIRWMPLSEAMSGDSLTHRSSKIISNEIGYHRVNLSMMLAGASWAALAARPLFKRGSQRLLMLLGAGTILYGQALTAGRAGYGTWAAVGIILCLFRWRRYFLIAPGVVALIVMLVPGVSERMRQGFGTSESLEPDEPQVDDYEVTSGRTLIWPYVLEKIGEAPVFGHGGMAMERTGLTTFLLEELHEAFPHPHNAYLELLLDNGWVGFALVIPFYVAVLWHGFSLFLDRRSPVFTAAGGSCLALVLALLVAAVGSQTFYPREGSVGMWCAIGLMIRVSVERAKALGQARRNRIRPRHGGGYPMSGDAPTAAPVPAPPAWPARLSPPAATPDRLDEALWARAS